MSAVAQRERANGGGRRRRGRSLVPVAVIAVLGVVVVVVVVLRPKGRAKPPNVVLVMTDDSHLSTHDVVANMRPDGGFAWIRDHGVVFNRMWSTDNVCCPGRTTMLTGQTAYNHHIYEANKRFKIINNALPSWLQTAGYDTGFAGKYLNTYSVVYKSRKYRRPPGWTYWEPLLGNQGDDYGYTMVDREGKIVSPPDYQTDHLAELSRAQLDDSLDKGKPAFVALWPSAPHLGTLPEAKYENTPVEWQNDDPSYLEQDLSDKPPAVRKYATGGYSGKDAASYSRSGAAVQVRDLLSVDDAVKSLIDDLRDRDELDNTVFILTTDNGYLLGEHHLVHYKEFAYEAAQLPLWIAGPGFPAGAKSDAFVTNLDIAPTIAKVAHAGTNGADVDGRPIQDILADPQLGRERFLPLFIPNVTPTGTGVKTWRYKYVHYRDGSKELYDLAVDPYELDNKADDPKYAKIKAEMEQLLRRAIECKGASCREPAPTDLQGASMKYPEPAGSR
jgi:arylsulfatase A-like enzyme